MALEKVTKYRYVCRICGQKGAVTASSFDAQDAERKHHLSAHTKAGIESSMSRKAI
jgi:hypothetical protein